MKSGVRLVFWLALVVILAGCVTSPLQSSTFRLPAPPLASAYDDLTEFWRQAANSLKIEPEEARLLQWNLGYDANGAILYLSFKLHVDREAGQYDEYYYSQHLEQEVSWFKETLEGPIPAGSIPAHKAFAVIDRIGFRELERHQNLTPPARFWFFAESGSTSYTPIAGGYVIQDRLLTPIGPEGITIRGDHGQFGIAQGALTSIGTPATTPSLENPGPQLFLAPLSPQN